MIIHYHDCSVCDAPRCVPCNATQTESHEQLCDDCVERWIAHIETRDGEG